MTHEMAWQEECGQDQMVGLLRAVRPAVVVREGFLEVMEQEPGLKRSRSGDWSEHRHRRGMGYEDPACIEVRILDPVRTQKGEVRDRGPPLLGKRAPRNWRIQRSPNYLILEQEGHELQRGLCMEAWASSRRLPGLKVCDHLPLIVPGARNTILGCCFSNRAWLTEGSPCSPCPRVTSMSSGLSPGWY